MLPIIAITILTAVGIKATGRLEQPQRTKLLNQLDELAATAGVIGRLLSAVESFRVVVAWQDAWKRGRPGEYRRHDKPPIGVPAPSTVQYEPSRADPPVDWDDDFDLDEVHPRPSQGPLRLS